MANLSDSFNRADNTSSLGTADSGQTWTAQLGTWGISSNQAYVSAANGQNSAVLDASSATGTAAVAIGAGTTATTWDMGVVGRATDVNNYYLAQFSQSGVILYKQVSGGFTSIGTASVTIAVGDTVSLTCSGSTITILVNGVSKVSVTDTTFSSPTKWGLRWWTSDNTFRYDNFAFTDAGGGASGVRNGYYLTMLGVN